MASVKTPAEMITPEEMAPRCGMSPENIRMAMRQRCFPVGFAIKTSDFQWRYYIPRAEFENWLSGNQPSHAVTTDKLIEQLADRLNIALKMKL